MNKRGQFFIIAAVLIVLILFTLSSVSTYAVVKEDPRTINELSDELNREGFYVIDYGVFNEKELATPDADGLVDKFLVDGVGEYFLRKTKEANVIFIYGNRNGEVYAMEYNTVNTGDIRLSGIGSFEVDRPYAKRGDVSVTSSDNSVDVKISVAGDEKNYEFDMADNELFYFVIVQKRGQEFFVNSNQRSISQGVRPGK
jgi:hypothetical protein